jgi:hypothetical protein
MKGASPGAAGAAERGPRCSKEIEPLGLIEQARRVPPSSRARGARTQRAAATIHPVNSTMSSPIIAPDYESRLANAFVAARLAASPTPDLETALQSALNRAEQWGASATGIARERDRLAAELQWERAQRMEEAKRATRAEASARDFVRPPLRPARARSQSAFHF